MSLTKMVCGDDTLGKTDLLISNINGLIVNNVFNRRVFGASDSPVITVSTSSSILGGINQFPALNSEGVAVLSDSAFAYLGVRESDLSAGFSDSVKGNLLYGADPLSTTGYWIPSVSFDYTGSEVEIKLRAKASFGAKYRVEVNGNPVTNNFTSVTVSSGTYYYIKLAFSDNKIRNIKITAYNLDFGGVVSQGWCRAVKPYINNKPKIAILSNSICAGSSNDTFRWQCWPSVLADILGFDVYNVSIGSTGYLADKPPTYQSRVVDIIGIEPDIIIFGDHYNDLGSAEADIKSAMDLLVATLKSQFPRAMLMMLGGWCTGENINSKQIALDQYVRVLCEANNMTPIMYANPYGNWDDVGEWITAKVYVQGDHVRYLGVIWECVADHTSDATINTFGFRATSVVTNANKATTLLADLLHPTVDTCRTLGAAIANSIFKQNAA